jgi:hypothetical protein
LVETPPAQRARPSRCAAGADAAAGRAGEVRSKPYPSLIVVGHFVFVTICDLDGEDHHVSSNDDDEQARQ